MRGALVFLCLVLGATAVPHPHDYEHHGHDKHDDDHEHTEHDEHDEHHDHREAGQKMRLKFMQDELSDLKTDMAHRMVLAKEVAEEINRLQHKVKDAEPTGCDDKWQFQCGGDHPKCISRLLVCDNQPDCHHNHADENEECRVYSPAGSIWEGDVTHDTCTKRKPKQVRLTIQSYITYDYLRSFPAITATLDFDPYSHDFDPSNSVQLSGSMDLMVGNNVMYFGAPEHDGLGIRCIFDGHDDYSCDCHIVYETTEEACADFFLERKDSYAAENHH